MKEVINNSINSSWDQIGELRQRLDNDPIYQAAFPQKKGHIFRRDSQEDNSQQNYIIEGNGKEFYVPSGSPLENIVANIFASLEKPNTPPSEPSFSQPESTPKRGWLKRMGDGLSNLAQRITATDEHVPTPSVDTPSRPSSPTSISTLPEQGAPLDNEALDAIHHRLDDIEQLIRSLHAPQGDRFLPSNSPVPINPDLNIYQMLSDLQNRLLHLENLLNNSPDRNSNFPNFPSPPASPRGHSRRTSRDNELTPASSPRSTTPTTPEHIEDLFSTIPAIQQNTPEQPFPHIPTAQSPQQNNTDTSSFSPDELENLFPTIPTSRQQGNRTRPTTSRQQPGDLTVTVLPRPRDNSASPHAEEETDLRTRFFRLAGRHAETGEENALRHELDQLRQNHQNQLEEIERSHQTEVRDLQDEIQGLRNSLQGLNSQLAGHARDRQTEKAQLQDQVDLARRQLQEANSTLKAMRAAHAEQVDYLRAQQRLTMQELQNQLEAIAQQLQLSDQQVARLLKQIDTLKQQHQQDLQKLKTEASQQQKKALENQKKELNKQFQTHLQTLLQQLQDEQRNSQAERDSAKAAFDSLKNQNELLASQNAQLQAALAQEQQLKNDAQIAQAALQDRISQLQQNHKNALEQLQHQNGQKVENLRNKLTAKHQRELDALTQQLRNLENATRVQLEKASANVKAVKEDLARSQEQLAQANALNRELQAALEQERSLKNDAQIAQAALQDQINQLQQDHTKAINGLKHQHGQKVENLRNKLTAKHQRELDALTQQLRDLENATRTQLEKAKANVKIANVNLRRVQGQLAEANKLNDAQRIEMARLSAQLHDKDVAAATARKAMEEIQRENAQLRRNKEHQSQKITDLLASISQLQQKLQAKTSTDSASVQALEKAIQQKNAELEAIREEIAVAFENGQIAADTKSSLTIQQLNQALTEKTLETEELRQLNTQLARQKDRLSKQLQDYNIAEGEVQKRQTIIDQLQNDLAESEEAKASLTKEKEEITANLASTQGELDHTRQQYEQEVEKLKTANDRKSKEQQSRISQLESNISQLMQRVDENRVSLENADKKLQQAHEKEDHLLDAVAIAEEQQQTAEQQFQLFKNKLRALIAEENEELTDEALLEKVENTISLMNDTLIPLVHGQRQSHLELQERYETLSHETNRLRERLQHELSHTRHPSVIFEPEPEHHYRSFSMDETALQEFVNRTHRENEERAAALVRPAKRRAKSVGGISGWESDEDETAWSEERDGRSGSSDRDSISGSSTSSSGSVVYTGPLAP
ncbi:MAG: hypothetical protein PVI40_05055 [Chlamydiota bacterium]|jgi:chromosome segregation ATPase